MLIIRDAYERVMHHRIETTLSCVRAKFCIVKEKIIKNVFRKCVICKKISRIAILPPPTPNLSDYRVNVFMFLFQAVGLDFAGPSNVKKYLNTDSASKVYTLILTCASCRVAHLELTPDMKIPAFLRALKRFIGRRGIPDKFLVIILKHLNLLKLRSFV